jgi:glycerol-3-phosphate dehydrogenase
MDRSRNIAALDHSFDLLVIGGGATGLGVAVDAAARGLSVALVEARDFGQATSSRSTKLVHGGVRYLRQGNIGLVREALTERGRLLRNAPHLTEERRFLIPAYDWWEKPFYGAGLLAYDLLAGSERLTPSARVSAREAAELVPTLARDGLKGGILYSDGQFDDARLAVVLARTADALGAVLVNDVAVTGLLKEGGRLTGATVRDAETGAEHTVSARAVVNATGVFTEAIRRMDDPGAEPLLTVSEGIHLVLDRSFLPSGTAIMVPRTDDGRVVFLIPWLGHTLIGTTDTPHPRPQWEPEAVEEDIAYLLKHAGRYLARPPERGDVLSVFSGLRPLVTAGGGKKTASLSRDHTLLVSPSGLVTITGGKWTTYRRMAEDTVGRAMEVAGLPTAPCKTANLRLSGADAPPGPWREFGADPETIARLEAAHPGALHPRLPYTMAMAAHVIQEEMPVHLEDVLSRRLRALLLDARAAVECAPRVADLMAALKGRDAAWAAREEESFRRLAEKYGTGA